MKNIIIVSIALVLEAALMVAPIMETANADTTEQQKPATPHRGSGRRELMEVYRVKVE